MSDDPCHDASLASSRVLRSLWAVPVSKHRVAGTLTEKLTAAVLKLQRSSPGVRKSNRGGWHSNASVLEALTRSTARKLRVLLLGAAGQYISRVTEAVSAAGGHLLLGDLRLDLMGLWANVNRRGDSNVAHIHPGLLSGVLYLQAGSDEGAAICFSDPRAASEEVLDSWKECDVLGGSTGGVGLQGLHRGDLLIFPSWLQHHVPPHTGSTDRISLSFNLKAHVVHENGKLQFLTSDGVLPAAIADLDFVNMVQHFQNNLSQHVEDQQECPKVEAPRLEGPSRERPPDEVASWIRSSGVAARWLCGRSPSTRTRLRPPDAHGSVSLISLPSGFVQSARTRRLVLHASAVAGIHVLRGHLILWLFDPRLSVEVAAAADVVARKLYGQKIALDLPAGSVATFPAVVLSSLEAREASVALSFVVE